MKSIQTKILGATDTKPYRIKASAEGVKPLTIPTARLDYDSIIDLHTQAARRLAEKYDWPAALASGGTTNPDVWVHCFVPSEDLSAAQYEISSQSAQLAIATQENSQLVKQLNAATRRIVELEGFLKDEKNRTADFVRLLDRALRNPLPN